MAEIKLTPKEERAIADLKRIARRWPKTLWLFSASGTLCVMHAGPNGERVHLPSPRSGVDPAMVVGTVNIPNDGGDW